MYAVNKQILPTTETEYLAILQNVAIIKNYQRDIRENIYELSGSMELVRPEDIYTHVLRMYYHNDNIKNTIRLKNSYNSYLKAWEQKVKIPITQRFIGHDFIGKLRKIGNILKAVKHRTN